MHRFAMRAARRLFQSPQSASRSYSRAAWVTARSLRSTLRTGARTAFYDAKHVLKQEQRKRKISTFLGGEETVFFFMGVMTFMLGSCVAMIPLYRIICAQFGIDGAGRQSDDLKLSSILPTADYDLPRRKIRVRFDTTVDEGLPWTFRPLQPEVFVSPGETALVFFEVENLSNQPVTGMSVYFINPPKIGQYFTKIQCFCFEEQRVRPHETVEMPVFFFIDKEVDEDQYRRDIDDLTLHYIFYPSNSENDFPDEVSAQQEAEIARLESKLRPQLLRKGAKAEVKNETELVVLRPDADGMKSHSPRVALGGATVRDYRRGARNSETPQ
ncbi:MAG: hypothetical protein MHM6MM_000576 [Cercozoa sp. M6MM]